MLEVAAEAADRVEQLLFLALGGLALVLHLLLHLLEQREQLLQLAVLVYTV